MNFYLEEANSQEFAKWWSAYRNTNEDFSRGFAEQYAEIQDVPFCKWIMRDNQRVGGMIQVKNKLGDFFLIPPYDHDTAYNILQSILVAGESYQAQNILEQHVPAFQQFGFEVQEARCWMLRPTQAYASAIAVPYQIPTVAQTETIAELLLASFQGGVGQYGQRQLAEHRASVENYFEMTAENDIYRQASAIVGADHLHGVCLVQQYKSIASLRFIAVHPDFQRHGLGRQLILHAINQLKDQHDYVGLAVTLGNPAQHLYKNLGFVAAPPTYSLSLAG